MSDGQFPAGPDGFFGIRLESIGGLGAHLAGQMLAEAVVLRQGLNASHFSSYGSEKKGTPVKSFVRIAPSDRAIRTSSPVETPQVVAVFHEALGRLGRRARGRAGGRHGDREHTLLARRAARRGSASSSGRSARSTRSGSRSRRRPA